MTPEHLDALQKAIGSAPSPQERRLLREVLYEATAAHSARVSRKAASVLMEERDPGTMEEDLLFAEALVSKGIMHNGLVPDLTAVQVQRAVGTLGGVLDRVRNSTLESEQLELLAEVFDHAADNPSAPVPAVRILESRVREGLGLEQRMAWNPEQLPLS